MPLSDSSRQAPTIFPCRTNDTLYGGAGADTFRGDRGNDAIYGGTNSLQLLSTGTWSPNGSNGYDVAEYSGAASRYAITLYKKDGQEAANFSEAAYVVVADTKSDAKGGDGTDTLYGVEVLRFSDGEQSLQVLQTAVYTWNSSSGSQEVSGYSWQGTQWSDTVTGKDTLRDEVTARAGNDTISTAPP